MKYSYRGFDQRHLVALGLDAVQVDYLNWFEDFTRNPRMEKLSVNGRVYFWVSYQALIDEFPIHRIRSHETVARKLRALVRLGVLEFHQVKDMSGTRTYYRLGAAFTALRGGHREPAPQVDTGLEQIPVPPHASQVETPPAPVGDFFVDPPDFSVEHPTQMSSAAPDANVESHPPVMDPPIFILIGEACANLDFLRQFDEFCEFDDDEYRRRLIRDIFLEVQRNGNTLRDVIYALRTCNHGPDEKRNIGYLFGILRGRVKDRKMGIRPVGKPQDIRLINYLTDRLRFLGDNLQGYVLDWKHRRVFYHARDQEAAQRLQDLFDQIIRREIRDELGLDISFIRKEVA